MKKWVWTLVPLMMTGSAMAEESGGFLEGVANVNNAVNGVVWGVPALVLLAFVGLLMTVLTKVFQVTHFRHWIKKTIGAVFSDKHVTNHTSDRSISQFQSLCTALAATVGTGNIVGVAGAIMVGGPGAVFWMWIMAFLGMMTNYSKNVLGIYYRRKNSRGEWSGGAMYYLRDGLGAKKGGKTAGKVLAWLFSAFFCRFDHSENDFLTILLSEEVFSLHLMNRYRQLLHCRPAFHQLWIVLSEFIRESFNYISYCFNSSSSFV